MLFRGSSALGYTNYPDNVVRELVKRSAEHGIDVFRIFDSLNWADNMKVAMAAVREQTSGICQAAVCYTGDILDPRRTKYSLDYYVKLAKRLVEQGAHMIAVKDMAGLCKPYAAFALVKALREAVGVPIHFHTHDTSGINAASVLRAADAGADVADAALASMSGMTSQPNLNSLVAALAHTPRDTGMDLPPLNQLSDYWEAVRAAYYPFEEGMRSGTAEVYEHEMPGGQYTNLRQQAKSLHLEERWHDVATAYAGVNGLLGDIVKVTPSSKVVGDLALFMVTNHLSAADLLDPARKHAFPKSVVEMMQGYLGQPEGGWPKAFQKVVLDSAGAKPFTARPGSKLPKADLAAVTDELAGKIGHAPTNADLMSYLMYPQVFLDYDKHLKVYDNTSVLPTPAFLYGLQSGDEISVEIEPGKTLIVRYLTTGEARPDGLRTVFFELNGQPREVDVPDRTAPATAAKRAKADPANADHVAAPMPGKVSNVAVTAGMAVRAGDRLLSIEAMKMETAVYAPRAAKVAEVLVQPNSVVAAKDLLVVLA